MPRLPGEGDREAWQSDRIVRSDCAACQDRLGDGMLWGRKCPGRWWGDARWTRIRWRPCWPRSERSWNCKARTVSAATPITTAPAPSSKWKRTSARSSARAGSSRFPASARRSAKRSPRWSPRASCPSTTTSRARCRPAWSRCSAFSGLGPKKVKALHEQLGIDTLDKLKAACDAGRGRARSTASAARRSRRSSKASSSSPSAATASGIDQALLIADGLVEGLRGLPGVNRMELCGSIRRRKETIKDIDILISSDDPGPIMERFVKLPGVVQVTGQGATKSSVVVQRRDGLGLAHHHERRPAGGERRAVSLRAALLHRQQGTQHRHAAAAPSSTV